MAYAWFKRYTPVDTLVGIVNPNSATATDWIICSVNMWQLWNELCTGISAGVGYYPCFFTFYYYDLGLGQSMKFEGLVRKYLNIQSFSVSRLFCKI